MPKGSDSERPEGSLRLPTTNQLLTLAGCVLFGVSTVLPVMRWNASTIFPAAGSARVFGADAYTLVDGAYDGAALVRLSAAAVLVVAAAVLAARLAIWMWWVQVTALAVATYYPLWVLHVFVRKLEDPVFPAAEGVVVLVAAFVAMAVGTYRSGRERAGRKACSS